MTDNPSEQGTASEQVINDADQFDGSQESRHDRHDHYERNVQVQMPLRPVPQRTMNGTKVHDITANFTQACDALETGQLVKDEYFTLFESIGALEIMDPKMDSGFLQPGEVLEDTYDTLRPLLPEEVIGIMDQLLCYEMAWHTGYPLSQTLFTSVYIDKLLWPEPRYLQDAQLYRGVPHRQPSVMHNILRAYCLGLIKCCDFAMLRITSKDYYEEEDFCTHTYNRHLFNNVSYDMFLRESEMAMQDLQAIPDSSISADIREALLVRLEFRNHFLIALSPDYSIEHLDGYWPPVLTSLLEIDKTQNLGLPVPGSISTKIQRRLASTVPPRPIVVLEFKEALDKLKGLCMDCDEATKYAYLEPDPQEYQNFVHTFAARRPSPLAYARSYLSGFIFSGDNDLFIHHLQEDLRLLVFPESPILDPMNWTIDAPCNPLLPKDRRLQTAELMDEFTSRANSVYSDFWSTLCQNRCRMRRMMCHNILAYDQLQADAGVLDDELMALGVGGSDALQYPLTTWVYHSKLRQVERIILLGFEQEIYLSDELAGMYFFLSRISETRTRLLSTVSSFFSLRTLSLRKAKDIDKAASVKEASAHIESILAESRAISELSAALSRIYIILNYLHLIPIPNRPFSTPSLRYELRMKPFLLLSPPEVLPFTDCEIQIHPFGEYDSPSPTFLKHVTKPDSLMWTEMEDAVKKAREGFSTVKKLGARAAKATGVEKAWTKEVQGALASCIALGVAIAGVKGAVKDWDGKGDLELKVELMEAGKRYSEGWVVPRISKI